MKYFLTLCLLIFSLATCKTSDKKPEKELVKEEEMIFQDLDGNPVKLSSFKGKRVLVNYWATWCIPCLMEFPSLVVAQEKLKDENYAFIFPSPDSRELIMEFQEKKKYPLRLLKLTANLEELKIYSLPTTVVYGTNGLEFNRHSGAMKWDSDYVIEMLKQVP